MNIPSKFDRIHLFYGKAKYAFLAVFVLTIMFATFTSERVYGDSVVGTVETKITLNIDGATKHLVTTQNTIEGALSQNGIQLAKYDITEPPMGTYLSGKTLAVSVVRAVPVLISDNGQSWAAASAYTQPLDILKQLNVEVFPEDRISAELILDPAAEGAIGQKVVIERAPVYRIGVDDTTLTVRSWATTVGEMLTEKGITLGVNDIVEPGKSTSTAGISDITITRINFADVDEVVSIPFKTETQTSYDMYKGQTKVSQSGVNGSKQQSVHIVYHNGIEVSREVTATTIIAQPQTQITIVGVKPYNAGMWWDIIVVASQKYGVSAEKMFNVMICESGGDPTRVSRDGYVGLFQWDTSFASWSAKAGYAGVSRTDGTAQIFTTALRAGQNGWGAWGYCGAR